MPHIHTLFFCIAKYNTNVNENEAEKLILRIPVEDKDAPNTPNSQAVFKITEGNEDNHFRIVTDPVTNEGLLYIVKVTALFAFVLLYIS